MVVLRQQQVPLRFALRNDEDAKTARPLEGDANAAADGAGCLDQIDGLAVLSHDWT